MATNNELQALRESEVPRGVGIQTQIFADRAVNAELWDVEGRRFIDLAAGIAVCNTGHNHPAVMAAVKAQFERFSHTCFQVSPYDVYVRLAQRLNRLAPGPTRKKTLFLTTGAEAVENSVKIARRHTGRSAVVSFGGAFHGRTLLAMALTGKVDPYKRGFGPFPAEVFHVPFPIDYHGVSTDTSLAALHKLFATDIEANRVAAIIVEPVQGEGGFYPAPKEFLQALRKICDANGIVLIVDEIQTGMGRTGSLFAVERAEIEPDLITVAKGLAGGLPLSGVVGKAEVMDAAPAGGLGGTFGGPPLACAAAHAVLDTIEKENLCGRALQIGEHIRAWAESLQAASDCVGHVRINGAMSAIELVADNDADKPAVELTKNVAAKAAASGVIILTCGVRGNVLRLLPPLTISDELLHEALDTVAGVVRRCATGGD